MSGETQWQNPRMYFSGPGQAPDLSEEAVAARKKIFDDESERRRKEIDETEDKDAKKYLEELDSLLKYCPCEPLNDSVLIMPERVGVYGNKKKDIQCEDGSVKKLIIEDGIKKNAKKATNKGTVIANGPGLLLQTGEFIKTDVRIGEVVMYQQYGYSEVYVNGILCHVARAGDLLLKAKDGKSMAGF